MAWPPGPNMQLNCSYRYLLGMVFAASGITKIRYAAEESGLLKNQTVFTDYEKKEGMVKAMLRQDTTGYVKPGVKENVGAYTTQEVLRTVGLGHMLEHAKLTDGGTSWSSRQRRRPYKIAYITASLYKFKKKTPTTKPHNKNQKTQDHLRHHQRVYKIIHEQIY